MIVTRKVIEILKTERGGYTSTITNFFGVRYPLPKGWLKTVVEKRISLTDEQFTFLYNNKEVRNKKATVNLLLKNTNEIVEKSSIGLKKEENHYDVWNNRDKRLASIGLTYAEYLKSDEWKKIRSKASKRDIYKKCKKCDSHKNINLHHKHYKWIGTHHAMQAIVPLCKNCHQIVHDIAKNDNITVQSATNILLSKNYKI